MDIKKKCRGQFGEKEMMLAMGIRWSQKRNGWLKTKFTRKPSHWWTKYSLVSEWRILEMKLENTELKKFIGENYKCDPQSSHEECNPSAKAKHPVCNQEDHGE